MQVISVGFGKETFARTSASLAAFHVTAGFQREVMGRAFQRQGALQRFPASQFPDINGSLFLDTVKVPDGQIILLQCSSRRNGRPLRDGAIFLRTRETGPMYIIKASLPDSPDALQTGDFLVFQGRADILEPQELEAYNIHLSRSYMEGFMDPEEVADCYTIERLGEEKERKPSFEVAADSEGNEVVLQKKPGRRIRLR